MLAANGPRTAKISRDVSNYIITLVLERSDDLIKNSYRRLTTENVARNEHWARIADKVTEKFDIPAEMERVKSHFHNRKKVLLARIKDELKTIPSSNQMSTDEKMEELVRRRICIGEYDEQLARVCLDIEDEEKGRTEQFGNEQIQQPMTNLFTETSHQSLLSQLLTSSASQSKSEIPISMSSPMESASSKDSEPQAVISLPTLGATRAPLLSKLLSDPSTSKENGFLLRKEPVRLARAPSAIRNPNVSNYDRKRRAASPYEKSNRLSVLPSPQNQYLSHLIVDVSSPQELKRLLSVLIDHGFSRFQHIGSSDMVASSIRTGIPRAPRLDTVEYSNYEHEPETDEISRDGTPFWSTPIPPTNKELPVSPVSQLDMTNSIKSRVERVDVEVKLEPCNDEDDEFSEEVDEQTAELEEQLATEAIRTGLALFGKVSPSPKRMKSCGSSGSVCGDVVTAICEICGIGIRLNSGGSKWNFFEHVMMKHSTHKPFKCSQCPYQAVRKVRVKQHGQSQHNSEHEPVNMITPEVRKEWLDTMAKCFPNHQYGKEAKI
ncbi:C2H2-type domain-containing protein [Caenorhabditis elegans]|uniref:C2H2-type domain-containing protein n=2 Tax=Caenorhabditis elegans TaxID=6239 RepID=Q9Y049_CAEEL|nr:C2H2-type domain-containing protein [Caenorhabditis elegans]CAA10263.1 LIR-2A protein [Caenorhabditis elegans]CCD62040.1 C2H2-type domain-containing protein [Caenorhabditis elegans]|eukprot:NP_001022097.1 LIn-26 Related [Caenorhabditis elegans]